MAKAAFTIHGFDRLMSIAFQKDAENLLSEFERNKSLKFADFSKIWKEMKFSFIFSEQVFYSFIQHFIENAFFVVKKFIVFPRSIYTEVGALYLLYAIYFKQPIREWVKIRITSEEYQKLQDLLERLKTQGHLEPLFVYNKLLKSDAFEYVFERKAVAPELRYIKNCCDFVDDTFTTMNKKNATLKLRDSLNEDNFLENFTKCVNNYRQALSNIAADNPGLGTFSSTLVEDLNSLINDKALSDSDSD